MFHVLVTAHLQRSWNTICSFVISHIVWHIHSNNPWTLSLSHSVDFVTCHVVCVRTFYVMLFWRIALSIDTGVLENHWRIVWNYYYRFAGVCRLKIAQLWRPRKRTSVKMLWKQWVKYPVICLFQGAPRFTVNFKIRIHYCKHTLLLLGLLVTVHSTLPLIAYLVFPSHFVVSFNKRSLAN